MYVYDIEEEDTLSDHWTISSTNVTINGLELTYPSFLQVISSGLFSVSMVTVLVTTRQSSCLVKYKQCTLDFTLLTYLSVHNKLM